MAQNKRVLSFVAVFFILALVSASFPADDQLGKSGSFDQPAVLHSPSPVDLSLCLIGTLAPLELSFNIPKNAASSGETRAPPA